MSEEVELDIEDFAFFAFTCDAHNCVVKSRNRNGVFHKILSEILWVKSILYLMNSRHSFIQKATSRFSEMRVLFSHFSAFLWPRV